MSKSKCIQLIKWKVYRNSKVDPGKRKRVHKEKQTTMFNRGKNRDSQV